jgi:hypothetical protein
MKRPTWVTVIGVLAIIFGCLGVMNATSTIMLPRMLEFQKSFMQSILSSIPAQPQGPGGKDVAAAFESFWGPVPGWFHAWSLAAGLLGLALSILYMYAAISLLQTKRHAVKLFYVCSGAAMVLALARGCAAAYALRLIGFNVLMGSTTSLAFHAVLLLVVATNDKSAFREPAAAAPTA